VLLKKLPLPFDIKGHTYMAASPPPTRISQETRGKLPKQKETWKDCLDEKPINTTAQKKYFSSSCLRLTWEILILYVLVQWIR